MKKPKSRGWTEQLEPFPEYWKIYGGCDALRRSVYLHASVVFTAISFPIWCESGWWDLSISLVPSLIGFLIGTFGLLLAFGGDYFKSLMARASGGKIYSALDQASANFCHFLVVQFACLLVALLAKSIHMLELPEIFPPVGKIFRLAFWGFGFLLFVYSIACALASVMSLFRISRSITIVENVKKLDVTKEAVPPPETPPQ